MERSPVIYTDKGMVQGEKRGGVELFRGIPYGGSVSGERRFCPPLDAVGWKGIRDCTEYGARAIQGSALDPAAVLEPLKTIYGEVQKHFTGNQKVPVDHRMDEECLYINVTTPGTNPKKRPVLVYIHGGAFMSGGGGLITDISDRMILDNDIVIASVNHRLNLFGYLYLGGFDSDYELSGIAGMLDLVKALQWVRTNIEAFGGDPENVTLIGESGGGIKILTLMAMPEAKGLFHKAIVISGAERIGVKSKEEGHAMTLRLLEKLGLKPKEWRMLLTMPAEQLFAACEDTFTLDTIASSYYPVADGVHIPINPDGRFHAYDCSADIPLMIGSSEDELAQWMPDVRQDMTEEELYQRLQNDPIVKVLLPGLKPGQMDAVTAAVKQLDGKEKQPWHILIQILSAACFLGGGAYIEALVKSDQGRAPVWLWSTTFDSYNPLNPALPCSWHTADLAYMFHAVWREEAESLSKLQSEVVAAFAKYGTPQAVLPEWEPFTREQKHTMIFDVEHRCVKDYYHRVHEALCYACQEWMNEE